MISRVNFKAGGEETQEPAKTLVRTLYKQTGIEDEWYKKRDSIKDEKNAPHAGGALFIYDTFPRR